MKKVSLIFGIVVLVCAALIFSGCEQETSTETITVNKGAAADLTALKELLATSGVNEVTFYGELDVNTETLIIPAGKTVTVKDGGVTLSTGVLGVVGGLQLPPGKEIVVNSTGTVAGGDAVLDSVAGSSAVKAKLYTSLAEATAAFGAGTDPVSAAVVNVGSCDLTAAAVRTGATLYVLGDVTISSTAPAPTGTVNALGRLVFGADANISSYDTITTFKYTGATLATTAVVTVTLPATPTIAAIDASKGVFTVGGTSTTGITVTKLTGTLALPSTVVAVDITDGPGSVTLAAADSGATFAAAATFGNKGTTTLSGAVTFSDNVKFGGDVVLTATKALTLASSKTLSLASGKSVKVGDDIILTADGATVLTAGGATTLTPAAATADTDAKLTLGGEALTLTSGALAIAEDAELALGEKLTVKGTLNVAGTLSGAFTDVEVSGTSAVLKTTGDDGKLVIGSGDNTATLTKATFTVESSSPVLTLADGGAITTAGTGALALGASTFSGVGAWTASVSADENDNISGVKITIATAGVTIGAAGSGTLAGTATLTASGTSPTITQAATANTTLTVGANTVIVLGGDNTAAVGTIKLTGGTNPGKLTLVGSITGQTGLTTAVAAARHC